MPPYLLSLAAWQSLWPIIVAVAMIGVVGALLVSLSQQDKSKRKAAFLELSVVLSAFSMLGIVTGYLSGFSREPTLGAVLPAVLSLMGGLTVFIIGKNEASRIVVSTSIFVFALTLLIGAEWGSVMRQTAEDYKVGSDALKRRAIIEDDVNEFRRDLDLPPLNFEKSRGENTGKE